MFEEGGENVLIYGGEDAVEGFKVAYGEHELNLSPSLRLSLYNQHIVTPDPSMEAASAVIVAKGTRDRHRRAPRSRNRF